MVYLIGVDVGTGSVRAGVVDEIGRVLSTHTLDISVYQPKPDFYEQSSTQIWTNVCSAVRVAVKNSKVAPADIKGIAFDATCSLVVIDDEDRPVTVSPTGDDDRNIILWMDHRALKETEEINETKHERLKYVGGQISPEMEPPKLMWLKRNLPESWKRAAKFLDLADFLSYSATGIDVRSVCTVACKWTYASHGGDEQKAGWSDTLWDLIGLSDLQEEKFRRIGQRFGNIGDKMGTLSPKAASALGLSTETTVAVGMIDAHSGGVGMLGAQLPSHLDTPLDERIALICGTSTCHMAVTSKEVFVPGLWGPYFSAMIPGYWLLEGGQSASGALLDHIINSSDCADKLNQLADEQGISNFGVLNKRLYELAKSKNLEYVGLLTADFHVLPYFHGNRSPRADPNLVGIMSGLKLSANQDIDALAIRYLAAIQAISYGSEHIISTLRRNGVHISSIFMCGGFTKNPLFIQQHTDITGCATILPRESDTVLLGSAVLAATGAGVHPSVEVAMSKMNNYSHIVEPYTRNDEEREKATTERVVAQIKLYHQAKYEIFQEMYDHLNSYRTKMRSFL